MGVVTRKPKCPTFMNVGLLNYIIELIICKDEVGFRFTLPKLSTNIVLMLSRLQAFCLADHGSFCCLLKFCQPSLSERDILHCHTIHKEILQCVHVAEGRVCENMSKIPLKISFMFDVWTSASGDPYLSLTAHYIDAPVDCPSAWQLRLEKLIFQQIEGRHTGKNMADILGHALDWY